MADLIIRRAAPADADALAAIGAVTFSETFAHLYAEDDLRAFLGEAYGPDRTRADLAHPAKASWLVEDEGQVVGYATAGLCELPHPDVGPKSFELKRFYLLKTCQNGGIGGRLWTEVMDWMLAQDPADLWIGVWSENHGAQRFYGRHGFEKVGEYGFRVGQTVDHEFILRRQAHRNSNETRRSPDTLARNP
jgi:ribosomal protein S18 acetylase RimI-like enzyme